MNWIRGPPSLNAGRGSIPAPPDSLVCGRGGTANTAVSKLKPPLSQGLWVPAMESRITDHVWTIAELIS